MFSSIWNWVSGSVSPASPPSPSPRQPTPPRPKLTDTPWRQIQGWDSSVREDLKNCVASLKPMTNSKARVPFFNILLTGQIKAGKSSYFNSINSLFADRVIANKADAGEIAQSLTKELRIYEVKPNPDANPFPWRILDTMGLDVLTGESDIRNILKAVDGHVPDRYEFTSGKDFHCDSPGFIKKPNLAQQAHCVAVVVDASTADVMDERMWRKLRSLRQGLISRNIPTYIILTHIDNACVEVQRDVKNAHRSIKIRDLVSKVGRQLNGLPENQIFPVKNYSQELELQDDLDILLLYALRQMLYSAQGHLENSLDKMNSKCKCCLK